jgi:superfamily II DNA or RNA helicase
MNNDNLAEHARLLTRLELTEAKLLTWGVVDGSFTREEICSEIERLASECGIDDDPERLLETLIEERLLFEFNDQGRLRYRSRMAEAVRLFARLRQIRPWNTWQTAPTLVSDFRFAVAPRVYPARDIAAREAIATVQERTALPPVGQKALAAMLRIDGDALTLAAFQLKATVQILGDLQTRSTRAVIVTAGTGTGKTKAFYLPALSHIAGMISRQSFWTKVLALYPRNELLKDQYSETFSEIVLINEACERDLPRRITIGVLFQDTPKAATFEALESWKNQGRYICPSLHCPKCADGSLEWTNTDIRTQREALTCMRCGFRSNERDVVLTRKSLDERPPDILFSTTEMLNRCMSDSRRSALFGVGQPNAPKLVLLDEVHTYEGTHGAQVAYLLRRWRWALRRNVQFTGLSATLENPHDFFSQLTGVPPSLVVHVPGNETEVRGMEYQLALRGDPVSATALLSTTIQAAMLLRRTLDSRADEEGTLFGTRAYVFTDNLDVVNRLYFDLRDAEGDGPTSPGVTLASYRRHALAQARERLQQGQSWKLAEDIGHDLTRRMVITRTSSQDTGVDRRADVIVATASLEVGYNDPSVGAVIQHKAPRDMASFLQRKGRAGRRPDIRPWIVVSLSDYGRDRFTYESYDQLFSPKLQARILPVDSRYVMRMQAVFVLMDWLCRKMPSNMPVGSVWMDFSGPSAEPWTERQAWHRAFLSEVLNSPALRSEFASYLKGALKIDDDDATAVLWEPPRSILMSVVPTLLRRLETGWRRVPLPSGDSETDLIANNSPLPDFIPPTLFSELSLPEVTILPKQHGITATMPILQAMQIMAPGNVTRRFAPFANCLHWYPPPDMNQSTQDMEVNTWCPDSERIGEFQMLDGSGNVVDVPCVRPMRFEPAAAPSHIRATSKGFLIWRTQIFAPGDGLRHAVPRNCLWSRFLDHIEFYTHAQNSHVTVRRFAIGAQAIIGFVRSRSPDRTINIDFTETDKGRPAGAGFTQDVDGIVVRFRYPPSLRVGVSDPNQDKIRSLRTAYFRHLVRSDAVLKRLANDFQLSWLSQMYLSAITAEALEARVSLEEAHTRLVSQGLGPEMVRVLDVIFQTLRQDEEEEHDKAPEFQTQRQDEEQEHDKAPEQKTRARLEALARDPQVSNRIAEVATVLWQEPDWNDWARERFRATLGAALLDAFQRCSRQSDIESLWLDLHPGPRAADTQQEAGGLEELWITEQTPGGAGIVERVLQRFAEDPMRFFRLAQEALGAGDLELVDSEISRLVRRCQEPSLRAILRQVRESVTNEDLRGNIESLRVELQREGFIANHAVMASLHSRVLRPGTNEDFDAELHAILTEWRREEERLGIEIDLRVISYVFGRHRRLHQALPFLPELNLEDPQWRYQAYASILWPRGNVVRSHTLSWWNPFATSLPPDRYLVLDCLEETGEAVDIEDGAWREKIRQALAERAEATLVAPAEHPALRRAIISLVAEALEVGFLLVFPRIEGVRRDGNKLELRIACREAVR